MPGIEQKSVPQTDATTFALSSNSILLLSLTALRLPWKLGAFQETLSLGNSEDIISFTVGQIVCLQYNSKNKFEILSMQNY